jgi:hypothetical protein
VKYTDYFAKFYMGRSSCGILGYKSKEKIPEYFMTAALKEKHHYRLPTTNSAYGKWFDGTRNPENMIWGTVATHFDEDGFIDKVSKDLNDSELMTVMSRFGIELHEGEDPDKRLFAYALSKQFHAIARGNGNAEDIVKDHYRPEAHIISFPEYAERTKSKYEKTEMPFSEGEERLLKDIYVCNTLMHSRHKRSQEEPILNATLELIAKRSKRVILVANGGMGKSMMLQHLFLESISKHVQTGLLPILIELRDFSENRNLFNDYIVNTACTFDRNLTDKRLEELMLSGKCQILMDGADEIDPSDVNAFQRQITDLIDKYPYNQYLVASRECDVIKGVRGFLRLYLRPFDKEQSSTLINNLLVDCEDETIKDESTTYLEDDFLKKHKVFASNPMLLTFVIMKYPIVDPFQGKKRLFYRTVYDTIVSGHDEGKQGYSRAFRSAQNSEEFTKVFSEFCAVTYIKHEAEFDYDTFDDYFNNLVAKNTLENPKIMTSKNFIHDACATACMMYEEELKLFYIDPGFQEYLFAKYYFSADPEELENLGRTLWNVSATAFDSFDAFDMLNDFASEKFEKYLLLPYLHNIFRGNSEDMSFLSYLRYGYKEIEYQVIDTNMVAAYESENNAEWIPSPPLIAEPSSIILSILLRKLDISSFLRLTVFEDALKYPECMTAGIFGEYHFDPDDNKMKIILRRLLRQDTNDLQSYERTHAVENYVRNDDQQLVCFGYEYKVTFDKVLEEHETYSALINSLKIAGEDAWKNFCKVKGYYEELIKKYAD